MRPTKIDYKKRVCHAMNYISQNIERDLSLEEIAKSASFSMFHFHRIFKAVVGETVAGFTRRLRLELAANRLISGRLDDITLIAMNYGFSSSQNFAKAFRQHFGTTPTEYRKSKRGNIISKKENEISLKAMYGDDSVINNFIKTERRIKMKAEVRNIPEFKVAYVGKIGPYVQELREPAFTELLQWAVPRNLAGPEKILSIYWDNPDVTTPEKCRFDACIIVPDGTKPEGQIFIQTISGGLCAVCHFELKPDSIKQAWEDSYAWICDIGYECSDNPSYELYHNNYLEHPEGKCIFDIFIPLKD